MTSERLMIEKKDFITKDDKQVIRIRKESSHNDKVQLPSLTKPKLTKEKGKASKKELEQLMKQE
jgi:hypothetical protein